MVFFHQLYILIINTFNKLVTIMRFICCLNYQCGKNQTELKLYLLHMSFMIFKHFNMASLVALPLVSLTKNRSMFP